MTGNKKLSGIRSTKGLPGGVRASLRPATLGLASVLASGAMGQEPVEKPEANVPVEASTQEPAATPEQGTPPVEPAPVAQEEATGAEAGTEASFVLPTVDVQAEAEPYKADSALTKLPTALIDTPQTVVVVPAAVIREQNATTLRDALRNVSGITVTAGEGGRQGDSFVIRGFSAQSDTYRDGVRDLGWFTRDTFNLGGVETFFGPSSVLFGRGSTGGAINLVTKKPTRSAFNDVRLSGGTAPSGRLELDLNQPITDRAQVRVAAVGQLAEVAGRNEVEENRLAVAPSARMRLTDNTSVEFDYLFQRENSVPDYGHPYLDGLPISTSGQVRRETFYGVKGSDLEKVDAHIATGRLVHTLREGSVLTNTLRFGRVDRFARPTAPRGLTPAGDSPTTIGRQRFETGTDNSYLVNQTDLRIGFLTAFLEHTLNVGVEFARENRDQTRNNLRVGGANLPADLLNPDSTPDLSGVVAEFGGSSETDQVTLSAYAADQVKIGRYLELMGSLRFDFLHTDYRSETTAGTQAPLRSVDRMLNWRVGVVGHPVENTSVYAMVGTSANPSAEIATLSTGTVSLDPERNQTYELGAKADLFDARLGLSVAGFRIDKLNGRVPNLDPEGPAQILEGEQRVEGFNLGVAGRILDGWQTMLSYTFLRGRIIKHSPPLPGGEPSFLEGQALPNTPPHSASLWTTYQVTPELSLGGGVTHQSQTVANNPTQTQVLNRVPRYWRVDAFARYAFASADVQLNLNNLTDALYYEQYYSGHAVPAEGFNANLTFGLRF